MSQREKYYVPSKLRTIDVRYEIVRLDLDWDPIFPSCRELPPLKISASSVTSSNVTAHSDEKARLLRYEIERIRRISEIGHHSLLSLCGEILSMLLDVGHSYLFSLEITCLRHIFGPGPSSRIFLSRLSIIRRF
jgi:hypothetical protein